MTQQREYPLSAVVEAIQSIFGWTAAVFTMSLCGCVLGYWLGCGRVTAWTDARNTLAWLPVLWLVVPEVLFGFVVTFVTWYLSLHFLTWRGMVATALVPLVVWVAAIFSMVSRFRLE